MGELSSLDRHHAFNISFRLKSSFKARLHLHLSELPDGEVQVLEGDFLLIRAMIATPVLTISGVTPLLLEP